MDFRRAKVYKHKALLVPEVMLPSWHVPDRTARLCGTGTLDWLTCFIEHPDIVSSTHPVN